MPRKNALVASRNHINIVMNFGRPRLRIAQASSARAHARFRACFSLLFTPVIERSDHLLATRERRVADSKIFEQWGNGGKTHVLGWHCMELDPHADLISTRKFRVYAAPARACCGKSSQAHCTAHRADGRICDGDVMCLKGKINVAMHACVSIICALAHRFV